jgi:hypothetical protein
MIINQKIKPQKDHKVAVSKARKKTQTTQIFTNKICKVEYYLQNSNLMRLRLMRLR